MPYRLPELLAADRALPAFIPEGEKDVDALRAIGLVATCNPGGAGKWRSDFAEYFRDRDVVILPDNDQAGRDHAADVRRKLQGVARSIRIIELPGLAEKGDVSDWLAAGGTAESLLVLVQEFAPSHATAGNGVDQTSTSPPDFDAEIARLARLSLLKYEHQRTASAKLLGMRASTLDRVVAIERGDTNTKGQGRPLDLLDPEPWPKPVNGTALLRSLHRYFARHLVLPIGAAAVMALWTVHSHAFEVFDFTPRLQFKAPTKGAGKSTALQLLSYVVRRPLETETISPAFLYRAIELAQPTALMDESDTYLRDSDDLRGVVNAGVKPGAQAGRCVGETQEPRMFNCHAPIALAGIGSLPGTIEDRALRVMMKRRTRQEAIRPVDNLTRRLGEGLCRKAARWAKDHREELRAARPDMKPLFNRAADRWRALYAIAEVAGDDWPARARDAMKALTAAADDDADSLDEQLLADIKVTFDEALPATELSTHQLVQRLVERQDRPWPEMGRNRQPLTAARFTRMVGKFGVVHRRLTIKRTTDDGREVIDRPWGYRVIDFEDAFGRYLDA